MITETEEKKPETADLYAIPVAYRKMENLHIVFWLVKDICWCIVFRPLGIAMIFPTLIVSIIIAWRTRTLMSELCHNLAITFWISANSYWMVTEFFGFDENIVFGNVTFKDMALVPFGIGALLLAFYYLYWKQRHKDAMETM